MAAVPAASAQARTPRRRKQGRAALAWVVLAAGLRSARAGRVSADAKTWLETAAWLTANGATVDASLQGNRTLHGGARIRGVVSSASLSASETLLRVPRRLWLTLDRYPDLRRSNLTQVRPCSDLNHSGVFLAPLKMAAAIATETKKGNGSFFAPYLRTLPTMSDFRSFHPLYMERSLADDFVALGIVTMAKSVQYEDVKTKACFEAWRSSPQASQDLAGLTDLSWEDVELGLARFRTRSYAVGGAEGAMIPGSDMLNTERRRSLNTVWSTVGEDFMLKTTAAVPAGGELFDPYCPNCDNERLLGSWGVYLEDNQEPLQSKDLVDCNARAFGIASTLQGASEGALDLAPAALAEAKAGGWSAPRCLAATFSKAQGPLRCSLARLAWEYCRGAWSLAGASREAPIAPRLPSAFRGGAATAA